MAGFYFECSECRRRYDEADVRYVCPSCAAAQVAGGGIRGVLHVVLKSPPARWPEVRLPDPQALAAFLPVAGAESLPSLPVGGTPLLAVPRLRAALGMPHLWLKDDTRNPSGSSKDRASQLVVAKAVEYGVDTVACASTGNAASALACVAAAAGMRAVVLVPASAPRAKLLQAAACGATLVRVEGSYDAAFELCLECCERFGWYNRNTAFNPFTIEGKKTAALEIAAELAPERPDAVIVPVGDGVVISGLAKGFADLVRGGLLPSPPRLLAVQPAGSAAVATAVRGGGEVARVGAAHSVADSLVVDAPRNGAMAVRAVRDSRGGAVTVDDEAIVAAIARLASLTGVLAEPAAAAPLAGLEAAVGEGLVGRDERVVLLVTGSGLKDAAALERAVTVPEPVAARIEAVAGRLRGTGGSSPAV